MRVLRLGTSNDDTPDLPEEQRGWKIAEQILADAMGESVDTILKRAWPNAAFPDMVGRWMDEFEPDIVVLRINWFWYGYESIPLWFERHLGPVGRWLGRTGVRVGDAPWFADNRIAQAVRRSLMRVLPGATYFTPEEVATSLELTLRRVVRNENAVVIVRGTDGWNWSPEGNVRRRMRSRTRVAEVRRRMDAICRDLHVRFIYADRPLTKQELQTGLNAARWHNNAEGERRAGEFDGQAMATAWQESRVTA